MTSSPTGCTYQLAPIAGGLGKAVRFPGNEQTVNHPRVPDAQLDFRDFVPAMRDKVRAWLAPICDCPDQQKSVACSLLFIPELNEIIIRNAWWRPLVRERRLMPHNRWLAAFKEQLTRNSDHRRTG